LIVILVLAGASVLQGAGPDVQWLGVLWTRGGVAVGNVAVSSGTTVVPGDVISTSAGSSAWIRFRTPASTIMLADTEVTLLGSDSAPSFLLRRGTVIVDENTADPVQVVTAGGYVLVKGEGQTGAECEMGRVGNSVSVAVKRGLAEIHGQGAPVLLHTGQSARVAANPEGIQEAGKINRLIPPGQIVQGGAQPLPLELNQKIIWNDLVKTLQTGRAQILLLDGSTLNVGSRSDIKVLKHDPQAQQTDVEMTSGEVEANVQKITVPGGRFELYTRCAVIETTDAAFVATSDDKGTKVCSVKGITNVNSSDRNNSKTVKLHKNECTQIVCGLAPIDPVSSPGEVASLLKQTVIEGAGGKSLAGLYIGVAAGVAAGAITGIVLATSSPPSPSAP